MFKRVIILVLLSSFLVGLLFFKSHFSEPVNNLSKTDDSSEFITHEYRITKIENNQYHGVNEEGKEIIFSAKTISTSETTIQVDDEVICYFEKGNIGKGIVKVEKKEK
ncbi:hypothetical protein ACWM35_09510 [Neobacillus sp. K501]